MYSSIAQSVEQTAVNRWVVGSSPTRGVLSYPEQTDRGKRREVWLRDRRLRGQAVKTSPFHGGNTGSIPVGVIFLVKRNIIYYGDVAKW